MYIYEFRYKLKPNTDVDELSRMFDELVIPICREIPGFVSATTYKYSSASGNNSPEWDYLYIEAWENKEAYEKAGREKLIGMEPDTKVYKTGFVEKFMSAFDSGTSIYATLLYSSAKED